MASLRSRLFNLLIRLEGNKRTALKRWTNPVRNPKAAEPPARFYKKYLVAKMIVKDRRVFTMRPKNNTYPQHLLYFHGGAYAGEISPLHWQLMEKIMDTNQCTMSMLEYPLIPEHTYRDTFAMIKEAYQCLSKEEKADFVFMGDSAGGGLSLAFAQLVEQENIQPKPSKLVLISPWLDVTMSADISTALEDKDLILNVRALKEAGRLYAGSSDPTHPLVSPIFGNFKNLCPIGFWMGTAEVFLMDVRRLEDKLKKAGVDYQYFEAEEMQHDYPLFPIPEGKAAVQEICNFLKE